MKILAKLIVMLAALTAPLAAVAQAFPAKPLRLIVRAPPGGTDDLIARLVASGRYNNSSEVVLAGLRILDAEETNLPENLVLTEVRSAHLDLVEGRYRQVLRMFARSGFRVTSLHRSLFGALELGDLPPGQGRAVTADSI